MFDFFKKLKSSRIFFVVLLFIISTTIAVGVNKKYTAPPPSNDPLDDFILQLEKDKETAQGGAVAIFSSGRLIYKSVFGYQKEKEKPITSQTLFPLASISKHLMSMALAVMVQKGSLDLEKKTSLPFLHSEITFENVLSHTVGIPFSGNAKVEQGMSRDQLLEVLKGQKPRCAPGKCYYYSNLLFTLIDECLKNQGSNFDAALDTLKTSLGIVDGIQKLPLKEGAEIAYFHVKEGKNFKALPFPSPFVKTLPASAGLFASLDAMIELYKLSFGYRTDLLSPEVLARFQKPYIEARDVFEWKVNWWPVSESKLKSFYGFGIRTLEATPYPEEKLLFHNGYFVGMGTFMGFIPSKGWGIIILSNHNGFALRKGLEFWKAVLKKS